MPLLRRTLALTGWGSLGSAVAYTIWTRNSKISPIPPNDYLSGNTLIARFNPNNNPVTHDVCTRKVPLERIKPELLQPGETGRDGRLVERFCAGVWSGWGYAYQRRYLSKKYQSPSTSHQLWTRPELASSTYPVGTQITDHFEVVAKSPSSIIVRCGDSPRHREVRESDGLFEMTAEVLEGERVVEFGLKSVFYNGLAEKKDTAEGKGPMGPFVQWLHSQYDKVLMETAIGECMK